MDETPKPKSTKKIERKNSNTRALLSSAKPSSEMKEKDKEKSEVKPSIMVLLVLKKKVRRTLQNGFFKLVLHKNEFEGKKVIARYMSSILRFKMKVNQQFSWNQLKKNRFRFKMLGNFVKLLRVFENNKKRSAIQILKINGKNEKGNKVEVSNVTDSRASSISQKGKFNKSLQSLRKNPPLPGKTEANEEEISKEEIKQISQIKTMKLSEEARKALKQVQRFDRIIYAKQTERICYDVIKQEVQRLERVKNSHKDMRSKYYDNQLTVTALFNHIKLIHQMEGDIQEMKTQKEKLEEEDKNLKKEAFRTKLEEQKNKSRSIHSANTEKQMHIAMGKIDEFLSRHDFQKARTNIDSFLKKYEKEDFAKDRVHLYHALRHTITDLTEVEDCMKQIEKILEILSIADLSDIKARIRTFKSNHKEFKYITTKYNKNQKIHGKQMINILHNLETFNNDLISLLESKVEINKKDTAVSQQPDNKKEYEQRIKQLEKQLNGEKTKIAKLENQIEKDKHKMMEMEKDQKQIQEKNKILKEFDKRISVISDKITKGFDWTKEFENLRRDKTFSTEKPYCEILALEESIHHSYEKKFQKEVENINQLFIRIGKVFHIEKITHEKRFNEVIKILELSVKKNPHLVDLSKHLEGLMVTIVEKTQEDPEQNKNKIVAKEVIERKLFVEEEKITSSSKKLLISRTKQKRPLLKTPAKSIEKSLNEGDFGELQSNYKDLQRHYETEKKQKQKLEKEISFFEDKMTIILGKSEKGMDISKDITLLKRDKRICEQKYFKIILQFYENFNAHNQNKEKDPLKIDKLSDENKKLKEEAQKDKEKNKQLSEKVRSLEKTSKEQNQKLNSLQKLNQSIKEQKERSQSKVRQISAKKKLSSQSFGQKNEEPLKLEVKKLQQQLKSRQAQEKKLEDTKNQIEKSIEGISSLIQQKRFKQIQNEVNKLIRIHQKNEELTLFINFFKILIQIIPKEEEKKITDLQKQLATESAKSSKLESLMKNIKQVETEVSRQSYQNDPDFVSKIISQEEIKKAPELKELIKLIKTILSQLQSKSSKLSEISDRYQENSVIVKTMTENLRKIDRQVLKKDFLNSDECWNKLESEEDNNQHLQVWFRILKKISQACRNKVSEDRKMNQKSIKSYQNQLQKINHLIHQYEKKLEEKDYEYSELYKTFTELQRNSEGNEGPRRSNSLKSSRKSFKSNRSNTEEKQETNHLKASLEAYAEQQKSMLLKINQIENEKVFLEQKIKTIERESNLNNKKCEEFQITIRSLQNNLEEEHEMYQREFNSWIQKSKDHETEISKLKNKYEAQFEDKQEKLMQEISEISRQREKALQKYKNDLITVQKDLTHEILHLKEQLKRQSEIQSHNVDLLDNKRVLERKIEKMQSSQEQKTVIHEYERQIQKLKEEQNLIITEEVRIALKKQEEDFNTFLMRHDAEIEEHFEQVIIPSRMQEFETEKILENSRKSGNQLAAELSRNLEEANNRSKEQGNIIRDLQFQLREKDNLLYDSQQRLKQQIQISQQVETSFTKRIVEIEKRHETSSRSLHILNNEREGPVTETGTVINRRSELQFEENTKKYEQIIANYERKIDELSARLIEQSRISTEYNILKDKCTELERKLKDCQEKRKMEVFDQENRQRIEIEEMKRGFTQKIEHYESNILELRTQIATIHQNGGNSSEWEEKYRALEANLSQQIGSLKRELKHKEQREQKYQRELQNHFSERQQINLLKEVINNQKIELKQLEVMITSIRESKEEIDREKQHYLETLRQTSVEKERQIYQVKSEYQKMISSLQDEKMRASNQYNVNSSYRPYEDQSSRIRIIELESQLSSKNMEIRQIEEMLERRRREWEDERERIRSLEREKEYLQQSNTNLESHIVRLQSDITTLNNDNAHHMLEIKQMREKEEVLRRDLIRVNTESERDVSLKEEVNILKHQIHQMTQSQHVQSSQDHIRVKKLIKDIEVQRNYDSFNGGAYDHTEIQILKKINEQVSELVETNRYLQTKCALLEAGSQLSTQSVKVMNIFVLIQQKMQILINFLLDKDIINNIDSYSQFSEKSRAYLSQLDFEQYMVQWLNLMKNLFMSSEELRSEELRSKAEEMMEMKEQMNQILQKQIEYSQDESYETLEKYKMIFTDIKFLLREYLKGGDVEYLNMINRSLGVDQ